MTPDTPPPKRHAPKGRLKARPDAQMVMDRALVMDSAGQPIRRQCTAKSKQSGQRCKRFPIRGHHVCKIHGGGTPLVRAMAQANLDALVDPVITRLGQLVSQTEFPSTALSACNSVLDRTGFGVPEPPPSEVSITKIERLVLVIQQKPFSDAATPDRVLSPHHTKP